MRTVLISGAGIAGLSLAYWLTEYGFRPTVVERSPALRTGGQAIDIRGTAREVISRMGLMDTIRAHHTGTHGIAFLNEAGEHVARMGGDDFGDSGGIVAEIEILRGDLVRILHEALPSGVEFLFGDRIVAMTEHADGVDVTFAEAAPRTFDIVVGADGVRSGVRELMFEADVRDLGYYSAYFAARLDLDFDGWELMYSVPRRNVILYPVGDSGEVRAMFAFSGPVVPDARRDPKALLAREFDGVGWHVPGLIEQLWRAEDVYVDRFTEVRVEHWSNGRVVLLGDSAFGGSIGMGTSMAIVGAYVLAGELSENGHEHAFARYQNEMRDYVATNRKRPPGGTNGFLPRTRRGIWLRNQFMRLLTRLPGRKKMMGGMDKAASSITLKSYTRSVSPG
ncbi:FAD-dependent monooxygenase [Kibdelosporangium philippinense]|uniref:FAD-dependent monooxygenase n=1 Tax=Kibdelosporangium philippinense TaxID=211113 RepID=A0ABS8ZKU9_9PSEU|nr:FAD-dependent monooxygenase [Kibdelosporangium philippinense]MCE7007256.1 FAD-dependent monooxygenase [Kibdelosporangium philippinense]